MSRDLGRDVPDLEELYARKLRADFSHPKMFWFLSERSPSETLSHSKRFAKHPSTKTVGEPFQELL